MPEYMVEFKWDDKSDVEWLELHRDEMLDIWNTQSFKKLPPLV